jgi:hypothetical protein
MRSLSALILLTVILTFSAGPVLAQDALNLTNATNVTNVTVAMNATELANETVATEVAAVEEVAAAVEEAADPADETTEEVEPAPQETASRFKQLSTFVEGETTVLGKNTTQEYQDVSATVDRGNVFTRAAGELTPAVKVAISKVNTGDDKYVEVTNQAVGSWDITGWTLASAGNTTFTFPELILDEEGFVRVHEGEGTGSESDIYTNSTAPLWIDNLVSLQDADGSIISTYDVSAAPAPGAWVDPLARQIQY